MSEPNKFYPFSLRVVEDIILREISVIYSVNNTRVQSCCQLFCYLRGLSVQGVAI